MRACNAKTVINGKEVTCMRSDEHKGQDHSAFVNGRTVTWR